MSSFNTQGNYNARTQNGQQWQKSKTEQGRRFQKYSSNRYKQQFTDENMSMNGSVNQADKKSMRNSYQVSMKESRKRCTENSILKESSSNVNSIHEFSSLKDVDSALPGATGSNNKISVQERVFHSNQYVNNKNPKLKNEGTKNASVKYNTKMNYKKDASTKPSETVANNDGTYINKDSLPLKEEISMHYEDVNSLSRPQSSAVMYSRSNQSTVSNDNQSIKCDLPYENIHSNHLSANSVHKVQNSPSKESSMVSDKLQKTVPFGNSVPYYGITFTNLELTDFLYYDVNLMHNQQLLNYAFSLRNRVLEKISDFKHPERGELEFVCALTDGTQTEKNQRLISARTCHIISHISKQLPLILECPKAPYLPYISSYSAGNPQLSGYTAANSPIDSSQLSDYKAANSSQLSSYKSANPSQLSSYPAANLQLSGYSAANPSQLPSYPAANPSQLPSYPAANLPQLSGYSAANPSEIQSCPATNPSSLSSYPATFFLPFFPPPNPAVLPAYLLRNAPQLSSSTTATPAQIPDLYNNNDSQIFENKDANLNNMHPHDNKIDGNHGQNTQTYGYENAEDANLNNMHSHDNKVDGNHGQNTQTYHAYENAEDNSSVNNTVENVPIESLPHSYKPIVNFEEVPVKPILSLEDTTFSNFELDNLLHYDVETMQGSLVLDYAYAVKERTLQNIQQFRYPIKDKLEFLCELTDGTQTEANQKLITARMCHLIKDSYHPTYQPRNGQNTSARYVGPRKTQSSHRRRY